jgi:hypothetical protein
MYSDYGDNYIICTELLPGDGIIHGGRTHIPIINRHTVISMGFHQTLEINLFAFRASAETQSRASADFRIMPNGAPWPNFRGNNQNMGRGGGAGATGLVKWAT